MRNGNSVLSLAKSADLAAKVFGISTEETDAFFHVAKVNELGSGVVQELEFLVENLKEGLDRTLSGLAGRAHQRHRDRGSEWSQVIGDFLATDLAKHATHPFIEGLDGEELQRGVFLKIVKNPPADLFEKRTIMLTSGVSGTAESQINPISFITDDFLTSNFEGREVSGEADHGGLFEEFALHGVLTGAFLEGLDLLDELADVFELSVDRDVANVGDRIDVVQLVHHFGSDIG